MDIKSDTGLSKRILILFIFTTLVLILQGIYNTYSLIGVNNSITKVYDSVSLLSSTSANISLPISELRQLSMSLVMAPNRALREKLKQQILELKNTTEQVLNTSNTQTFSSPEAGALFDDIKAAWKQYSMAVKVTIDYVNSEVRIAEFISVTVYEKSAYDQVTVAISAFNTHQLRISNDTFEAAQESALFAFWAVLITTVIEVFILKFILAYVLNLVRHYTARKKQHEQVLKLKNEALTASNDALKKTQIQLQEASAHKSLFLAKMSHEIRTPMSGVLGMSEILSDLDLSHEQEKCNDVIRASGETLLAVINDILDYSKIEAGKMQLESIPFNLETLVWEVLKIFRVRSQEKNIPLMSDFSPQVPLRVVGDPSRLRQILINLISNALKFTSDGEIMILINPVDGQDQMIRLSVRDTGLGIDKQQQQHIFSVFSQGDATTTRKHGGTGLGLAICEQLSQLMGGRIGVDSELGRGSTFWVEIQLPADKTAAPPAELASLSLAGKHILCIDNNSSYRALLLRYASRHGIAMDLEESPRQALEKLHGMHRSRGSYDLLLSDFNMPGQDGLQFARKLALDTEVGAIPMVLMTGSVLPPKGKDLEKTNIILSVEKPLVEREFIKLLNRAFSAEEPAQIGNNKHKSGKRKAHSAAPLKILVAEDNATIRLVMHGMLKKVDQQAVFAVNGIEAVKAVSEAEQPFDVVFMDCEMPEMDGLQASAAIRLLEERHHRPPTKIIALTAHVLKEQVERCQRAGMDDFMSKPINFERLRDTLEKF